MAGHPRLRPPSLRDNPHTPVIAFCGATALLFLLLFGFTAVTGALLIYGALLLCRPGWMEPRAQPSVAEQDALRARVIDASSNPLPWYLSPVLPLLVLVIIAITYGLLTF